METTQLKTKVLYGILTEYPVFEDHAKIKGVNTTILDIKSDEEEESKGEDEEVKELSEVEKALIKACKQGKKKVFINFFI